VKDHRHTRGFIRIIILFDEVFKYGNDVKFWCYVGIYAEPLWVKFWSFVQCHI
jgi:hypothetical protein